MQYTSATEEEFVENHAHDVGSGGMFLRSTAPLPPGTLVAFEIRLAGEQAIIAGVGRVVWKRDTPDGQRPAGMGVKFIDVDDPSQEVLDRLLAASKGAPSEYEQPKAASAERARTVLGLGSAVAPPRPVSAPDTRSRTQLGIAPAVSAPVPVKDKPIDRSATHLGLAPPVAPAALIMGDQSSPSVNLPPPRPVSTSEIDGEWGEPARARPPEPAAVAAPVAAPVAVMPAEPAPAPPALHLEPAARVEPAVHVEPPEETAPPSSPVVPEPAPRPQSVRPSARRALEDDDDDVVLPRKRLWPWVLLLLIGAAGAVYHYREALHRAGLPLIPTLPLSGLTGRFTASPPPPAPISTPASLPSAPPARISLSASAAPPLVPAIPTSSAAGPLDAAASPASSARDAGRSPEAGAKSSAPPPHPSARPRPPKAAAPNTTNPF